HKITLHEDYQWRCEGCDDAGVGNSGPCSCPWMFAVEASNKLHNMGNLHQALWNAPLTDKILVEAGYNEWLLNWRFPEPRPGLVPSTVSVIEQGGVIPGITFKAPPTFTNNFINTRTWRASISYVTGANNMKFGYFGGYQSPEDNRYVLACATCPSGDHLVTQYRENNGVMNQISFQGATSLQNIR